MSFVSGRFVRIRAHKMVLLEKDTSAPDIGRPPSSDSHPYESLTEAAPQLFGLQRRARPKPEPPARWVRSLPAMQPRNGTLSDGALKSTSAFARFISEALFLDAAEALELIVRMAPELVPGTQKAHFLVLSLTDEPMLTLAASGGAIAPSPLAFPVTDGVCGYVARSGMSVIEPDASAHLSYSLRFEAELLGRSPVLCLPVGGGRPVHASAVAADGSTPAPLAGVLVLCGSFGARFGEQELLVARALLDLVRARADPLLTFCLADLFLLILTLLRIVSRYGIHSDMCAHGTHRPTDSASHGTTVSPSPRGCAQSTLSTLACSRTSAHGSGFAVVASAAAAAARRIP